MAKKEIVVIGIGRFATELINRLNTTSDFNIVAIDSNQSKLEKLVGVKNIIIGDATKTEFLLNIGIENADYYVIGMGQDFKTSLVVASIIKNNFAGKVLAKSIDENHESIMRSLGVEDVITPEVAAAGIVYRRLINPLSEIKGGETYRLVEVVKGISLVNVPVLKSNSGQTIKDIKLPKEIAVALVIRDGKDGEIVHGDTIINEGDVLSLIGKEQPLLKHLKDVTEDTAEEVDELEEFELNV